MAAGEIGCHSATLPHYVLKDLAKLPYDSAQQPGGEGVPKPVHPYRNAVPNPARLQEIARLDPLAPKTWDGKLASTDIDYLANQGAALDKANNEDPETKRRLHDAIEHFISVERQSQAKIEDAMKAV